MQQLDKKAVWLFFVESFGRFLVFICLTVVYVVVGLMDLTSSSESGETMANTLYFAAVVLLVVLILAYIWAKLSYHFYRYELREDGFRKELGVIYKKYITIPYDRMQNVDVHRGILARLLGLSDLNIQTAGSSATVSRGEGRLPGLSREVAEQVRDELVRRARTSRTGQGL